MSVISRSDVTAAYHGNNNNTVSVWARRASRLFSARSNSSLPETGQAKQDSILHRFPLELLFQITDELPASSHNALRNTCRDLQRTLCARLLSHGDRFELLRCMERDDSSQDRFLCGGCQRTHHRTDFPPSELEKDPRTRRCIATKKLLWLCPYAPLSFSELAARKQHEIPLCCGHSACHGPYNFVIKEEDGTWALLKDYYFSVTDWQNGSVSKRAAKKRLRGYDLPICPHLRTSDPEVTDIYSDSCIYQYNRADTRCKRNCPNCRNGGGHCKYCRTTFFFCYPPHTVPLQDDNIWYYSFIVKRNVGKLEDPKDPVWLAQLMQAQPILFARHWVQSTIWELSQEVIAQLRRLNRSDYASREKSIVSEEVDGLMDLGRRVWTEYMDFVDRNGLDMVSFLADYKPMGPFLPKKTGYLFKKFLDRNSRNWYNRDGFLRSDRFPATTVPRESWRPLLRPGCFDATLNNTTSRIKIVLDNEENVFEM
ncbi:hypothetical protein DTO207G8_3981 [Paecilomyces variotii]|nr:hypothetical protein DTO207G8_3981 [Paecilomyces variotii]KAJ9290129.1 hypothetical protein DTO021C3_2128 [Paecilomyces variotii]KAJ9328509.1 hypothetical protein DTO027B3_775 [Paecilomyces variotii]KAJ9392677.1 hypothetical protein DTO063F5_477 [Paecilomyces variotii]KAJ9395646.1 hypothetical protein DTO282F9_7392 [Paecilomyces variotii]